MKKEIASKNIIIIGLGGLGIEVYSYIKDDIKKGYIKDRVKGFLDDYEEKKAETINSLYLGKIQEYRFEQNDYVIVAIANIKSRKLIIEYLKSKKVKFYKYIHHSVFVAFDAIIEEGTIICPNSMIQSNSKVGSFSIVNIFSSIGHDSVLGSYSVLSPYCTLNGNVTTGKNLFMGTRSSVLLKSSIGSNCIISANTTVKGVIKDNFMVKDKISQVQVKNRLI